MKYARFRPLRARRRRSPCGERGLKYKLCNCYIIIYASLPVRGAWIEMDFATA